MKKRYRLILILMLKVGVGQALAMEYSELTLEPKSQSKGSGYCLGANQGSSVKSHYYLVKDWKQILHLDEQHLDEQQAKVNSPTNLLTQISATKDKNASGCR